MSPRRVVIVSPDGAATELRDAVASLGYSVERVVTTPDTLAGLPVEQRPTAVLCECSPEDDSAALTPVVSLRARVDVPVIALFPASASERMRHLADEQPGMYLVHPFTPRELRATIELGLGHLAAARRTDELEERFFSLAVDLLCMLDFSGYFTRLNPAWEGALGYSLEELMSRPFIEFVHPDDRERTLAQNQRVRAGEQALAFENRYLCKDGTFRWLRWNAAPDTRYRTIFSVARDVTATKAAEEERERLMAQLQSAIAEVQVLQAILPMCSYCRRIRDEHDSWHSVEGYIARHTRSRFSHGVCPTCMSEQLEPQLRELEDGTAK